MSKSLDLDKWRQNFDYLAIYILRAQYFPIEMSNLCAKTSDIF